MHEKEINRIEITNDDYIDNLMYDPNFSSLLELMIRRAYTRGFEVAKHQAYPEGYWAGYEKGLAEKKEEK